MNVSIRRDDTGGHKKKIFPDTCTTLIFPDWKVIVLEFSAVYATKRTTSNLPLQQFLHHHYAEIIRFSHMLYELIHVANSLKKYSFSTKSEKEAKKPVVKILFVQFL